MKFQLAVVCAVQITGTIRAHKGRNIRSCGFERSFRRPSIEFCMIRSLVLIARAESWDQGRSVYNKDRNFRKQ